MNTFLCAEHRYKPIPLKVILNGIIATIIIYIIIHIIYVVIKNDVQLETV